MLYYNNHDSLPDAASEETMKMKKSYMKSHGNADRCPLNRMNFWHRIRLPFMTTTLQIMKMRQLA